MISLALSLALGLSPTMAGPSGSAVNGSIFVDATNSLYLTAPNAAAQCANANITTDQGGAVTVTRASTTLCQKADLTYVTISANKPVVEADGLRIEPSSTNRVAYSEALEANWTLTNATKFTNIADPLGGSLAEQFDCSIAGCSVKSPTFTITGTSAVLSAWTANEGAVAGTLVLRDTTAGADRCTITIATSSAFASTHYGRPSCNSSAITSGNNHQVWFFPGGAAGMGAGVTVWGVSVEPGVTIKTAYIATSGTAVTRAADVITTTITDNSSAGCSGATFKALSPGFPQRLLTKGADFAAFQSSTQLYLNDSTLSRTSPSVTDLTGRSVAYRSQWSGSLMRIDLEGNTGTTAAFDGSMGAGTTVYIGSNSGVQVFQGWVYALKFSTSPTGCTP